MFYDPVWLRTIARFSAPDPWSGNQLIDYCVAEYVMMPVGSKRARESKWAARATGIQWESDTRYRLLPEALVELWKAERIPSEKLPWLLHAIEPRLLETDCIMSQPWQTSIGIPFLLLLLVCPVVFSLIRVEGQRVPVALAIASGLLVALSSGLILLILQSSKQKRMKQQTEWTINFLSPGSCGTPLQKMNDPFQSFFKLWIKLFAIVLWLTALVLGVVIIYSKVVR